MAPKNIIIGQKINREKIILARHLRQNMTEAEKTLWQRLRANRLGGWHFRRQQIIAGFIVDFYCHKAGLIVELDGNIHNQQIEYDKERENILKELGLQVIRIPNQAVIDDIDIVLERILEVCLDTQK